MPTLSSTVQELLTKRGITTPEDIERFIAPDYVRDTHDPFLLVDMDRAVARILLAIAQNEKIAIYADFDCDGIPGAALMRDFFTKIGYDNVVVYIPHRDREGHGVHKEALAQLRERGVSLVITIDVGTTAIDAIEYAHTRGLDVIVTDHHELKEVLPSAVAVINPRRAPYPFPDLCGAAIAWKLACAVLRTGKERGIESFLAIPDGWEKWLLDLVAIATIADLMPLVGENRVLVHFGLKVLRKSPRLGIRALCASLRISQATLTEDDVSFSFAPRINAASRMGEPEIAFKLLISRDIVEAEGYVAQLEALNAERKGVVASMVRAARKKTATHTHEGSPVLVVGDAEWKPSLAGLVASALLEDHKGMVCVWGRTASGEIKGSCRSDGSISVVDVFSNAQESLLEYGGHRASGGFSVVHEQIHNLGEIFREAGKSVAQTDAGRSSGEHDLHVALPGVTWSLLNELEVLAPFGVANPKPVVRVVRTQVGAVRVFGKQKNHLELELACIESGVSARAFDFFRQPENFTLPPVVGARADVLATLVRDTFGGRNRLALRLLDVIASV